MVCTHEPCISTYTYVKCKWEKEIPMKSCGHMLNTEISLYYGVNVLNWDPRSSNSSPKSVPDFVSLNFSLYHFSQHNSKMICKIFKPKILSAFFPCPGSDIRRHFMAQRGCDKLQSISIQSHISFTGGGHHMFIKAQLRLMHSI